MGTRASTDPAGGVALTVLSGLGEACGSSSRSWPGCRLATRTQHKEDDGLTVAPARIGYVASVSMISGQHLTRTHDEQH